MDGRTVKTPGRLRRLFLDVFTLTLTRRVELFPLVGALRVEDHPLLLLLERER